MDPPNINFLFGSRAPILFFDINRYNRQIFRHSLRVPPPPLEKPPEVDPEKSNFCTTKLTMPVFLISVDLLEANILTEFGGTPGPPNGPLKDQFLQRLLLEF